MSQKPRPPGFETRAVHAGTPPDPVTGARAQPIYQTTAYVFDDVEHAAALFNLSTFGYIYSRLTNPTVAALEERIDEMVRFDDWEMEHSSHRATDSPTDERANGSFACNQGLDVESGAIADQGSQVFSIGKAVHGNQEAGLTRVCNNRL
jgi:hypothetical protein